MWANLPAKSQVKGRREKSRRPSVSSDTSESDSDTAMERIAKDAGGRLWFQLYMWREKALSDELVRRVNVTAGRASANLIGSPRSVLPSREKICGAQPMSIELSRQAVPFGSQFEERQHFHGLSDSSRLAPTKISALPAKLAGRRAIPFFGKA
jgi:hypothetical protein